MIEKDEASACSSEKINTNTVRVLRIIGQDKMGGLIKDLEDVLENKNLKIKLLSIIFMFFDFLSL